MTWMPTWPLITTKHLEIRKRRGLIATAALLAIGPSVLVLLLFHAIDPASYGPAGDPGVFAQLSNLTAEFGFIVAATLGAAAGTTDLTEGVFRNLVITGRSRLALYLARIPPAWRSSSRSWPRRSPSCAWSRASRACRNRPRST